MPYENLDHPGASGGSSNTGEPSMKMFTIWVLIAQAVGLLAVILTAVWMSVYHGGFSWVPERVFNFHPLFMVIGLVFLYADVYRVFRSVKKFRVKVIHASLHILALIFGHRRLKAQAPQAEHVESALLLGLTCVLLFCLQWVGGLIHFLLPQTPQSYRKMYLPIHQHWGVILFCMTTRVEPPAEPDEEMTLQQPTDEEKTG
uniref:Transmembrane ascorbate-dependent reductase CYB561 n=1 Tax=Macrostomum lignano TaxID=282301 RepID=A0A1I8FCM7_9PLAT